MASVIAPLVYVTTFPDGYATVIVITSRADFLPFPTRLASAST